MDMTSTSLIGSIPFLDAVMLAKQYGPYLGLLILGMLIVLWRDRRTGARLLERIRTLEEEIDNALLPLAKERIR
jgi:hypothetical protein